MVRWLAPFVLAICVVAAPRSALATSCAPPTPEFGEKYSDVIFEALCDGDAADSVARLKVDKVYKGTVPAEVTARYGGMKGFASFERGKRYLVWGRILGEGLWVHLCGPTHVLPTPKFFTEGRWKGWSAEKQYGPPRKPGASLIAAPKGSASAVPKPDPPPEPTAPAPTGSIGVEVVPLPDEQPPTTAPDQKGGGCAGCAQAGGRAGGGPLTLLLALLALAGRYAGRAKLSQRRVR